MPEYAEQALSDFPAFDRRNAINEFGNVGRKSVNTKLKEISPFYADLYNYLFSEDFLSAMSAITGIPDLISDPTMYGGGTHENLDGQGLDPHVDFNYLPGGGGHRRVNLLIYLNKEWDISWGGAIEMHSNPRRPETNEIHAYNVTFNRAVMFETNEYSWHGFPRIQLPQEKKDWLSRKCLSIYLYTRTRPADEIAGSHGTFYVPRPMDPKIKAGLTLTGDDAQQLHNGYRRRDDQIEMYQKLEERLGRERTFLEQYIENISKAIRLPTIGNVLQVCRLSGNVWHDGWTGSEFSFEMRAIEDLSSVEIQGSVAQNQLIGGASKLSLKLSGRGGIACEVDTPDFHISSPIQVKAGDKFTYSLSCSSIINPAKHGVGADQRDLSMLIKSVRFR